MTASNDSTDTTTGAHGAGAAAHAAAALASPNPGLPPLPQPSSGTTAKVMMALGVAVPLSVGLGIYLGMVLFGAQPATATALPSASATVAKSEPPPEPPKSLAERAATGDFKAQEQLKAQAPTERSAEETLAIARGRSLNKTHALQAFAKELATSSEALKDEKNLLRLREFFEDRETTNLAAATIASLQGELGPDLFFDVWSRARKRDETSDLAETLLEAKDVRAKASPALSIALDLRKAEPCEEFLALLPRIVEHADQRSLQPLTKLQTKVALKVKECGPNKNEECFKCLRDLDEQERKDKDGTTTLTEAVRAAAARRPPKLPR